MTIQGNDMAALDIVDPRSASILTSDYILLSIHDNHFMVFIFGAITQVRVDPDSFGQMFAIMLSLCMQSLGVLLTVSGFVIIFLVGSYSSPDFPHAIVGIILTFLLIQQFLSGIL